MRTLRFLLRKEITQIVRDRTMLRMLIAMPLVQLLVLSNAATFEVRHAAVHLVDLDGSSASRGLALRLTASGLFEVTERSASMAVADEAMLDRRVSVIMAVPPGFEQDLVRIGSAPVQLVLNAEDGAAAGVSRAYLTRILQRYAAELDAEIQPALRRADPGGVAPSGVATSGVGPSGVATSEVATSGVGPSGVAVSVVPAWGSVATADAATAGAASTGATPTPVPSPRVEIRSRGWFNPELDYHHYMVPGILVVLVTMIGVAITSMNIVREKEIGTLEQLNVTPITRTQFIAGKLIPFWIIALVDMALGLVVARLVFDVPMEGSLLLVFGATVVYLVAALGIGLWISTVVETQQQAMLVTFAFNMIFLLMSGLFTPIDSMPEWAQWLAELSPVKHFIVIMRGVLVRGAGLADVQVPLLVLAGWGVAMFTLAVRQHSKTSAG